MKTSLLLLLLPLAARAEEGGAWQPRSIGQALANSLLFSIVGIVMILIAFKVFDRVITKIDIEGEIQKGNVAASILAAGFIIAIGVIIAAAIY